jgi:hypothetical protein
MTPEQNAIYLIKTVRSSTGKVAYTAEREVDATLSLQDLDSALGPLQGWLFIPVEGKDVFGKDYSTPSELPQNRNAFRVVPFGAEHLCLTGSQFKTELKSYDQQMNQHWQVRPTRDGNAVELWVCTDANNLNRLHYASDKTPDLDTRYWQDNHGDTTSFTLEKVSPKIVPELSGGAGVYMTLGPTKLESYIRAEGEKKAVMFFVDFPDTKKVRGTSPSPDVVNLGNQLVGPSGEAAEFFKNQSNGTFTLKIDVKSEMGTIDLGEYSSAFLNPAPAKPNPLPQGYSPPKRDTNVSKLITSLKAKAPGINFTDYDMTFIVLPKEAATLNPDSWGFPISPSYTGEKVIVFGADCYKTFYRHLVHEVGHQFGLPDLYPYNQDDVITAEHTTANVIHSVGCWSIMACMLHSSGFLGWERHKLGWLDGSRKLFLNSPPEIPAKYTLTPLTQGYGIAMIILPVADQANPERVLVVEIAQDSYGIVEVEEKFVIRDVNGVPAKNPNKGVLIYTVDATVGSGGHPIQIIPQKVSKSVEYSELWEAPFEKGDSKEYTEGDFKVKVSVDDKVGEQYVISISNVSQ